jgi:hypothetical protein
MKHSRLMRIACSSALLLGLLPAVHAQEYPPRSGDRPQESYEDRLRAFDRIRDHLDRVEAGTIPFGPDHMRLSRARARVGAFYRRFSNGEFDRRDLDEAIGAMQRVADNNRMSSSDRDLIADDLHWLRELRERHDHQG